MKFSLILAVAVAINNAVGALAFAQRLYGDYEITKPISPTESSSVLSTEPFVFVILYVTPRWSKVSTSLFKNAGPTGCDTGSHISHSFGRISGHNSQIFGNVVSGASNAQANTIKFTVQDIAPLATNGTVNLCARIGFDGISYMDTYVNVNVTATSNFGNFTTGVNIKTTAADELNSNMTTAVSIASKLCANGTAPLSEYKIGQSFSVCVNSLDPAYYVKGFKTVTCSNSLYTRPIFVNYLAQPLSSTVQQTNATKFLGSKGVEIKSTTAFESVVVAGYFTGGSTNFTCSGEVALSKYGGGRRMLQRFEFDLDDTSRLLQESETGNFETEIGLEGEATDFLEAGASMASIIGTAGLMGLSALMVLAM